MCSGRVALLFVCLLSACGGGSGGVSVQAVESVQLHGFITFDFVPEKEADNGLDYERIERRPVRHVRVELLDARGEILATTLSDETGHYQFMAPADSMVKVRVASEMMLTEAPAWHVRVTDNVRDNRLYVLDGSLVSTGRRPTQRNLHAASGWDGASYASVRAAAPFAILDTFHQGVRHLASAGDIPALPYLEVRWSIDNVPAGGELSLGEIGTSFYQYVPEIDTHLIYLLGSEDVDTDEYDRHVVLHEWTHFLQSALSRDDSLGGAHTRADRLDARVAFSEGLANALAGIALVDPIYHDSSGGAQAWGFRNDVRAVEQESIGWYSEGSVGSVVYRFYENSGALSPVLQPLFSDEFRESAGLATLFSYAESQMVLFPQWGAMLDLLLTENNVHGRGHLGAGETNNGDYPGALPLYKPLIANGEPAEVCITSRFGTYNGLGTEGFLYLSVPQSAAYTLLVEKVDGSARVTDPDVVVYHAGRMVFSGEGSEGDVEQLTVGLPAGEYVLNVYDASMAYWGEPLPLEHCFAVSLMQ